MKITLLSHPACTLYEIEDDHPECAARLHHINDQLIASGLAFVVQEHTASQADKSILQLAHDSEYIEHVYFTAQKPVTEPQWLDDDTLINEKLLTAALCAAGACKDAVDLVLAAPDHLAFCVVRPPGHHAAKSAAAGFCIFNNAAIAAKYALTQTDIERVAIVDFDVHHGDGTQNIVEGDDRILLCSSFQHPFYPFSGDTDNADNIHNITLPAGTQSEDYRTSVTPWFEKLNDFAPDLIIISAGFDAHREDDLAHLRLKDEDYFWFAQQLKTLAQAHAGGRVVATLEGGYALSALARSVVAFIKGMM